MKKNSLSSGVLQPFMEYCTDYMQIWASGYIMCNEIWVHISDIVYNKILPTYLNIHMWLCTTMLIPCFTNKNIDHNGHTIFTSGIRSPLQKTASPVGYSNLLPFLKQQVLTHVSTSPSERVNVCVSIPKQQVLTYVSTILSDKGNVCVNIPKPQGVST